MAFHNLRDGDAVETRHGFVFYIFGYEHTPKRYNGFLKYVPEHHAPNFDLQWLPITWNMRGTTLLRPKELYSPQLYPRLVDIFRNQYPQYAFRSEQLDRWMITIPRTLISNIYRPSRQLMLLKQRGPKDILEEKALELIGIISKTAKISTAYLGVHGSISIGTQHEGSDIDIAIYGAANFKEAKEVLLKLESEEVLSLKRADRFDSKKLNRGIYEGYDFVVNATRRYSEIDAQLKTYRPLYPVDAICQCISAHESVFRPAIYKVNSCREVSREEDLNGVREIVSMIGMYRGIAEEGETIQARGMLEEVEESGMRWLRIVIGAAQPDEFMDWIS